MRFTLTDEQEEFRNDVRTFAREEVEPVASDLDERGAYPADVLDALGDMRLTGLTLPERYGGKGGDLVDLVLMTEELSAAQMSVASALALHLGVATVIERFGTDEQREEYLPAMACFDTVGALGLSEENAGSDKLAMETVAEREAEAASDQSGEAARREGDEWVLDGHKRWVTNFEHADVVLTYAKTGPDAEAPHNVSAFLVPIEAFEVEHVWDTLGARSVKTAKLSLSDAHVPDDALVGEVGEGYVQRGQVHTGVNVPARAVGIARAALEDTVAHASDREQWGKPIGSNQGVRWRVSEMATRVDAARLLTLRAADRAQRDRLRGRELSMAKVHATEAAVENTNDALQIHGGVGYTRAADVERYLRDARLLTIAGGPNELHRSTVADEVFPG